MVISKRLVVWGICCTAVVALLAIFMLPVMTDRSTDGVDVLAVNIRWALAEYLYQKQTAPPSLRDLHPFLAARFPSHKISIQEDAHCLYSVVLEGDQVVQRGIVRYRPNAQGQVEEFHVDRVFRIR
ncbi:MAG: hypothetical protein AMXMBFR13_50910 [Phycisphaerae bacterium]